MKTRRSLLTALLVCATASVWAESSRGDGDVIAVIVNLANPANAIGASELRPIFQTTKTSWASGGEALPINLPEDDPLRKEFDQAVLGLNSERVARYWTDRKIRGGARPPIRVSSAGAMLKAVAAGPGAVGYVKASEVNASVKVVAKISGGKLSAP